jgi:putative FmdB family regulatory protein
MPFYEYECPSCRYYLEVLQKISDKPPKKCPSCGKAGFKRLMSAPVFRLKGSGWYETDFKSDKEGQRNLAGAEPAEAKAEVPAAKAGDDKSAKPDTAATGESAKSESSKSESSKATDKDKDKKSKPSSAPARSGSTRRTVKRPAARAARKGTRAAKRGSRRR